METLPGSGGECSDEIDGELCSSLARLARLLEKDPSKCLDDRLKPHIQSLIRSFNQAEEPESSNVCFFFGSGASPSSSPSRSGTDSLVKSEEMLGSGCYIVESEANNGTLIAHWSDTPVQGALAYSRPRKAVPNFKFSQNHGKSELVRGIGAPNSRVPKAYHRGWLDFLRNYVKAFNGSLVLLPSVAGEALDVGIFLHMGAGKRVVKLEANQPLKGLDNVVGAAVTSYIATCFDGIAMTSTMFIDKSNSLGAGYIIF